MKKVYIRAIKNDNIPDTGIEQVNETCPEAEGHMSAEEAFAEPLTGTVAEFMPPFLMKALSNGDGEETQMFMFRIHDTEKDIYAEITATVTIDLSNEDEIFTEIEFDDIHDKSADFTIRTARYDIDRFPITIYRTYCELIEQTMLMRYYGITK